MENRRYADGGPLAHRVEQGTFNPKVPGSSPGRPTLMDSNNLKIRLNNISEVNPALTCYHRDDPAPVLPLRDEPDLLSWLESTGRLVTEKDADSQEISTIEEEELSALMGEKEDYKTEEDSSEDDWED